MTPERIAGTVLLATLGMYVASRFLRRAPAPETVENVPRNEPPRAVRNVYIQSVDNQRNLASAGYVVMSSRLFSSQAVWSLIPDGNAYRLVNAGSALVEDDGHMTTRDAGAVDLWTLAFAANTGHVTIQRTQDGRYLHVSNHLSDNYRAYTAAEPYLWDVIPV